MTNLRILIIDFDNVFASKLKKMMEKNGFPNIQIRNNGEEGLELIKAEKPEIIITEVDLPGMNGLEICQELRRYPELNQVFIIFHSVKPENYIKIAALNSGADDYLIKPVNERYFLAKLAALSRRLDSKRKKHEKNEPGLLIDYEKYIVIISNKRIMLPKKEFQILSLMYKNPGKVFSREEIKSRMWKQTDNVNNRTIDVHVKKIREKIGPDYLRTIRGFGYKFEQ